ncbi:MAG: hypothetical protein Q9219_003687 [cf. Caloplaca sp. 3 TL-2023]
MHPSILKHLLAAAAFFKGLSKLAAATPTTNATTTTTTTTTNHHLFPRYDYEPGDELKRTMCFCTSDNALQQTDNDPEAFYNNTLGHRISYIYQYEYYNNRLKKRVRVESPPTACLTHDSTEDPYYHNDCLSWETQDKDFCHDFTLPDLPPDIYTKTGKTWRFCYLFRGDELDDPSKRDFFSFDGGKRAIPRMRDWIAGEEEVKGVCGGLCKERYEGMELFESRYGGWFSRVDGFHHFDDICTKDMNCVHGPGHHEPSTTDAARYGGSGGQPQATQTAVAGRM